MTGRFQRSALVAVVIAAGAASPHLASADNAPHIGYVYPAGGKAGSTFRIMVGGQNLGAVKGAWLSGGGAEVKVLSQSPAVPKLDREQADAIRRRIKMRRDQLAGKETPADPQAQEMPAPDHPMVEAIAEMDALDLKEVESFLEAARKLQPSPQLSRLALLEITLAAEILPSRRELRLLTPAGLSNPVAFHIGTLPEICFPRVPGERGSNPADPLKLPVVVNGQVLPGQTRKISFQGKKGERFTARLEARSLIPYISDAVPGWFQAVVAIEDSKGKEIAFADDFLFQPDPILQGTLPSDGVYTLVVRDALYRGRQDFVFRVAMGNLPILSGIFPLGAREGSKVQARLIGTGLPVAEVKLDTSPGGAAVRTITVPGTNGQEAAYAVGRLHEVEAPAGGISLEIRPPVTLNGRLEKKPVQQFRFSGQAGEKFAVRVMARQLGSPLDAAIEVKGPDGQRLAAADDENKKEGDLFLGPGLLTHQADPALEFTAKTSGIHMLELREVAGTCGPLHNYRISIAPPEPNFELAIAPSAINLGGGNRAKVTVRVLRKEGFAGPVQLAVAPSEFRIEPAEIPAGVDKLEAAIVAKKFAAENPVRLRLLGLSQTEGKPLQVEAIPVDDTMQAFLWRHLKPARELLAVATKPPPKKPSENQRKNNP